MREGEGRCCGCAAYLGRRWEADKSSRREREGER